jgi:YggT family protein
MWRKAGRCQGLRPDFKALPGGPRPRNALHRKGSDVRLPLGANHGRVQGMYALVALISRAIDIYIWLLIGSVILSWLVAFNVVNTSNKFVYTVGDFLYKITEPALRPIRRVLPNMGGIDISPIILILLLYFLRDLLYEALL